MALQRIRLTNHSGGLSDDDKFGAPSTASELEQIDFRKSPGRFGLTRKLAKESGPIIVGEIHDMVRVEGGDVYMAGGAEIYKRTPGANGTSGTYSVDSNNVSLTGVKDIDYRPDLDTLFLYDNSLIHELYDVTGTPTYDYDKYHNYVAVDQNDGVTSNAYTLLTSVTEGAANIVEFTCENEPLASVIFNVDAKGASGDWIATLHDGANNTIATKTIAFASVPAAGSDIEFTFSTPIRLKFGAEYHVHLHATAGTHAVHTETASDLSTADFSTTADRLVDTGEYGHFTIQFGPKTFFCNERYMGEWDILDTSDNATSGFSPHQLVLPPDVVGIGAAIYNEFIAIACGRKRGTDTQNDEFTDGVIFFWNTVSALYDYSIEVPQGAPFGIYSQDNILHWEAKGVLYRWAGGDIEEVYEFPGVDNFEAATDGPDTEVYLRGARRCIAGGDELTMIGLPHTTANVNFKIGVYSYGNTKSFMPKAIGYTNKLSTGNTEVQFNTSTTPDTPVTGITCVKQFGTNLLVAWKDVISGTVTYGVDYVNDLSGPVTTGRYLSLVFDDGVPEQKKTAMGVLATAKSLPAGCTITPIIEYDRSGTFTNSDGANGQMTATQTMVKLDQHNRFRECRFGVDVASSSGNFPEGISVILKYDDNIDDEDESIELNA